MNKWLHKIQGILASWRNICFSRGICSQELLIFISVRNLQHRVVLRCINLISTAIVARWQRNAFVLSNFWGIVYVYSQLPPFVNCWETRRGKAQARFYCATTRIMEKFAVWCQLTTFTIQGLSSETNNQPLKTFLPFTEADTSPPRTKQLTIEPYHEVDVSSTLFHTPHLSAAQIVSNTT